MNRFVEHQMLTTFKEFRTDCHRHFKKYSDPEEAHANPPNALEQSRENKDATEYELAERKGEPIDCVELFWKHTFKLGCSCCRPQRMCIIKCWNSNPSLPWRVVSHSVRMRYAIRCWVDDHATQNALVGDPSRRLAGRRVRVVRRHLVHSPHKKRLNYKLNLMKLWNGLKYKIDIIKR
uniref:CACTA en-spm transposon protein n=1 Tax=Cucumis melo TaxID=3656 RepID=A0A9I9ED03_CUCME